MVLMWNNYHHLADAWIYYAFSDYTVTHEGGDYADKTPIYMCGESLIL